MLKTAEGKKDNKNAALTWWLLLLPFVHVTKGNMVGRYGSVGQLAEH